MPPTRFQLEIIMSNTALRDMLVFSYPVVLLILLPALYYHHRAAFVFFLRAQNFVAKPVHHNLGRMSNVLTYRYTTVGRLDRTQPKADVRRTIKLANLVCQ